MHRFHRPVFINVNMLPCPACGLQPSLQHSPFNPGVPSASAQDSHGWEKKYKKKKHLQRKVQFHLESSQASTHRFISTDFTLAPRNVNRLGSSSLIASAATTSLLARIFVLLFLFCFFVPPTNCVQNAHGAETKREAAAAEL